jgi:leucyl-tRNA synthetase
MWYKDALKYGFFELQSARDWYREVTADAGGMHIDLVKYWIRVAALIASPIAPHFAEHIWRGILNEPKSIQVALWPELSSPVERTYVEAGGYMRGTVKMIRDAELGMMKKMAKGKRTMPYDPKAAKAVRVYVASSFPEWQEGCVKAVQKAYAPEADKVDDGVVKELLTASGLIKDKRAMPFVQTFKVSIFCDILV